MQELVIAFLKSVLRTGLGALCLYLLSHKIISEEQGATFVTETANIVIPLIPGAVSLGWSWLDKLWSRQAKLTALTLHKGATENDLNVALSDAANIPSVRTPPNTAPGVPKP